MVHCSIGTNRYEHYNAAETILSINNFEEMHFQFSNKNVHSFGHTDAKRQIILCFNSCYKCLGLYLYPDITLYTFPSFDDIIPPISHYELGSFGRVIVYPEMLGV